MVNLKYNAKSSLIVFSAFGNTINVRLVTEIINK